MSSHPPRRTGFTLLELLVSIVLIVLLMAILMPALQSGRTSSRRAAGADNLRQLAEVVDRYLEATGGFPGLYVSADWQWGGVRFSAGSQRSFIDYDRPLNRYLPPGNRAPENLFYAPADAGIRGELLEVGTGGRTCYRAFGTSYRANARLFDAAAAGVSASPRPLLRNEITTSPSRLLVLGDPVWFEEYEQTGRNASWYGEEGVGNLLFLDGSVRYQRMRPKGQRGPAVVEPVLPGTVTPRDG